MQYKTTFVLTPALRRFLEPELVDHIQDSLTLLSHMEEPDHRSSYHDYAFIVFPIAKAYEGFLKQYFVKLGVIDQNSYRDRHFRVGRSFNPDLPQRLKDETWLYDDVRAFCGEKTARSLWNMWIDGRNHTFHYFSDDRNCLNYPQAKRLVERFLESMELAMVCQLQRSGVKLEPMAQASV